MHPPAIASVRGARRTRRLLRATVFGNLGACLALCFAASQSFLALWWIAMWTDAPPVDAATWVIASALLATLHILVLGRTGAARVLTQCFTPRRQAYAIVSFSSCIVAGTIAASMAFGAIASSLLGWAGPAHGLAFSLLRNTTTAAGFLGIAVIAAGSTAARSPAVCRRLRAPLAHRDSALSGKRILHLSDLHIGNGFGGKRLEALIASVNALGADLIAITGDLFDQDPTAVEDGVRALAKLDAPLGVFVVLGNHDAYTGLELIARELEQHAPAIRLLRGEIAEVKTEESVFYVAGLDDPGEDWRLTADGLLAVDRLSELLPGDGPAVLLVHRPDIFGPAASAFDLVLAGHYHGGQITVPGSRGSIHAARLLSDWVGGTYRAGASILHVSRGIGCTGPRLRIGCRPEFSLIEIL